MERRKVIGSKNGGDIRRFAFGIRTVHSIYRFLINIFYPNICPCCEEIIDFNDDFCDECHSKIIMYNEKFHIENADLFTAYCMYDGKVRYAVRKFKYEPRGNSYYAFACGIVQALRKENAEEEIEEVVYIPMTRKAYNRRGYNQTKLIANEIHYLLGIPCRNILVKTHETKSQKSLGADERRVNLKDAFMVRENADVSGKCILVIDDLCTTGSTLSEAARALKKAGAKKVITAAFAKTKGKETANNT